MKVPNFSWDGFLMGIQGDTVTWQIHLDGQASGDPILDLAPLKSYEEYGTKKPFARARTTKEGAGQREIPDNWLLPCNKRGTPIREGEKPHHWIISEHGMMMVRSDKKARHIDHGGKYTFADHENMILSNARHWHRTVGLFYRLIERSFSWAGPDDRQPHTIVKLMMIWRGCSRGSTKKTEKF